METSRRQLCSLLAVLCSVFSVPALCESIQPQDYRVPAEFAGDACRVTDPSDPHQILGPNPAHADCLTAMYPASIPAGTFATEGLGPGSDIGSTGSILPAGSLWFSLAALAMLVLAGFNSRKRHRQLPMPGLQTTGTLSQARESLHTHTEGSRWHED